MKVSGLALSICAAASSLLSGCAATQLPLAAPGAMPQSRGSWMQRAGTSGDLLYVTRPPSRSVDVYTYPAGNQVGTLTGFTNPYGICSDTQGNVWIADDTAGSFSPGTMVEYAHGGTTPIAQLSDSDPPLNCSVDPTTGNLAVASNYFSQRVAVYAGAQGSPQYYYATGATPFDCSYDARGNLFAAAKTGIYASKLFRLRKGASALSQYKLVPFGYADFGIGWDGKRLAIPQSPYDLSRYALHKRAGRTVLDGPGVGTGFWIAGSTLIVASGTEVAFYRYPKGGMDSNLITSPYYAFGVTVSVGSSR
jgi:hypothetical protein